MIHVVLALRRKFSTITTILSHDTIGQPRKQNLLQTAQKYPNASSFGTSLESIELQIELAEVKLEHDKKPGVGGYVICYDPLKRRATCTIGQND